MDRWRCPEGRAGVLFGLVAAALLASCTTSFHTFASSTAGRAFVLMDGNRVLNCDATGGAPRCWSVVEVPNPAGEASGGQP